MSEHRRCSQESVKGRLRGRRGAGMWPPPGVLGRRQLLRPEKHQQMRGPGQGRPAVVWNKKEWPCGWRAPGRAGHRVSLL